MCERLAAGEADDQHSEENKETRRPVRPEQAKREFAVLRIGTQNLVCQMQRRGQERPTQAVAKERGEARCQAQTQSVWSRGM